MATESNRAHLMTGRRVVVTRARAQSGEITALLESQGAEVVHLPTIEIVDPSDGGRMDAAIDQISTYDWIVFTSVNAVARFLGRIAERRGDPVEAIAGRRVCAIGPATAKAVRAAGREVDVVAEESISEGVLRAITNHIGGEAALQGLRFLIPRARVARDLLPSELRRLGACVDSVEAYQTVRPDVDPQSVASIFAGGTDAITFTSPSTVSNFSRLAGLDDLSELLRDVVVACIGPSTSAAALKHGLKKVVQPEKYTSASMVEALARAFASGLENV